MSRRLKDATMALAVVCGASALVAAAGVSAAIMGPIYIGSGIGFYVAAGALAVVSLAGLVNALIGR